MNKDWIKFKRGLFRDPKHRRNMGESIWLYGKLVDRADFSSGIVPEYKDEELADEMEVSVSCIRKWRRKLEASGYLSSQRHGAKGMTLQITKWINPRLTSIPNVPLESDPNGVDESDTDVPLVSDTIGSLVDEVGLESDTQSDTTSIPNVPLVQVQNEHASILPLDHITTITSNEVIEITAKHPAIQRYRETAKRYPNKSWYQEIGETVGDHPDDLERWRKLVYDWCGSGWNPSNVKGMLEAYRSGGIQQRNGSNGSNGHHPDKGTNEPISAEQLEWARQVKEEQRRLRNANSSQP